MSVVPVIFAGGPHDGVRMSIPIDAHLRGVWEAAVSIESALPVNFTDDPTAFVAPVMTKVVYRRCADTVRGSNSEYVYQYENPYADRSMIMSKDKLLEKLGLPATVVAAVVTPEDEKIVRLDKGSAVAFTPITLDDVYEAILAMLCGDCRSTCNSACALHYRRNHSVPKPPKDLLRKMVNEVLRVLTAKSTMKQHRRQDGKPT
jgi:hypothetical protein